MSMVWSRPITIARGVLSPAAGGPEQSPPASGATITIYDSTKDTPTGLSSPVPLPFSRLVLNIYSSNDSAASGVVFNVSSDGGAHWRQKSAQTYSAASGLATYDVGTSGVNAIQIQYTNSANTLTAWEMSLEGVIGDRNPGS